MFSYLQHDTNLLPSIQRWAPALFALSRSRSRSKKERKSAKKRKCRVRKKKSISSRFFLPPTLEAGYRAKDAWQGENKWS
jgi:hypothetical protein